MGKVYNPNRAKETAHEEPNSNNVEIGDVHLHREWDGGVIPFSVKKIGPNSFSAERMKKEPGLTAVTRLYENAVVLKKGKGEDLLLVGRNCTKNLGDYVDYLSSERVKKH